MASLIQRLSNFISPTTIGTPLSTNVSTDVNLLKKDLSNAIFPAQVQRIRQDVSTWRDAAKQAESAFYPWRTKQQILYIDTILNGHVKACMSKRNNLTMLRAWSFYNGETKVDDESLEAIFKSEWFEKYLTYVLEKEAYGYSLISLGDIKGDAFPDIKSIKRWNVSPDRYEVLTFQNMPGGYKFLEEPYRDWHVYCDTPSDNGSSPTGYGYLYSVALYEIFLRNLLGFNGDFVELFAQPFRVAKSSKSGKEREELYDAIRDMGSSGFTVIDLNDEIEFLETALGGTGYKSYDNFEARLEKKISKIILGHSDAMDSTPGKLGSQQGNEDNPVSNALDEKATTDGRSVENNVNNLLIPRMRNLGFNIPDGLTWKLENDKEKMELRENEDKNNAVTVSNIYQLKQAGFTVDPKYIEERTGIPVSIAPTVAPNPDMTDNLKKKVSNIYKN
jgi:hypothetical protein